MKLKKLVILLGTILLMLIWVSPITAQDSKGGKHISLYRMIVNERILKCEIKATMYNSNSKNIRKEAALAKVQAKYLKNNKEKLVQNMIDNDIGTKPHQVNYYLIKNFFANLRSNDSPLLEAYSKVELEKK
jgi:hypothetical protein